MRWTLQLALGALVISASPVLVALAIRAGLSPLAVGGWRMGMAALAFLGGALILGERLRLPRARLLWSLATGVAFAIDLAFWHEAIVRVGPGLATILGNTQVFWSAGLAWLLLRDIVSPRLALSAAVAFGGVVLLAGTGTGLHAESHDPLGVTLGLATGLAYASVLLLLRQTTVEGLRATVPVLFWVCLSAAAGLFPLVGFRAETLWPQNLMAWVWVVALAFLVQVLGWIIISSSLPRLPAARAGLILLIQPALAAVWGAALGFETFGPWQIVGGGLVLIGVFWGQRLRAHPKHRAGAAKQSFPSTQAS